MIGLTGLMVGIEQDRPDIRNKRGQGLAINCTEIILVDALCPIQFWNAKCLK